MKNIFFLIAILFSHSTLSQNFKQMKETIHQFELTNLIKNYLETVMSFEDDETSKVLEEIIPKDIR